MDPSHLAAIIDVHSVDSPWPTALVTAGVGAIGAVFGAVVGGWITYRASKSAGLQEQRNLQQQLEAGREADRLRFNRELLAQAADSLYQIFWEKERSLCDALDVGRSADDPSYDYYAWDAAHARLAPLDLEIRRDVTMALPKVVDPELRERLLTVHTLVNDCYNLAREETPKEAYSRAMLEVQQYMQWLRWNLGNALQGEPLPPRIQMPNVRRDMSEPPFEPPRFPKWA